MAKLLLKHNVPMGVSLISPYKENRANAREIIGDDTKFFEVYVNSSLAQCEERDVKGMYAKHAQVRLRDLQALMIHMKHQTMLTWY